MLQDVTCGVRRRSRGKRAQHPRCGILTRGMHTSARRVRRLGEGRRTSYSTAPLLLFARSWDVPSSIGWWGVAGARSRCHVVARTPGRNFGRRQVSVHKREISLSRSIHHGAPSLLPVRTSFCLAPSLLRRRLSGHPAGW